jgi:hypothetical protein
LEDEKMREQFDIQRAMSAERVTGSFAFIGADAATGHVEVGHLVKRG